MTRITELVKLANELDKKGLRAEANFVDSLIKKASDSATLSMTIGRAATEMAEAFKTGDVDAALRKHSEIKKLLVDVLAKMPAKKPEAKPQLNREQRPSGIQERLKHN